MKDTKDILTPYQCPDCRQEWVEEGYTGHIDCPNCGRPRVEPIVRGSDILFVEDGTFSWDSATGAWIAPHCALPDGFTYGKAIGIRPVFGNRTFMLFPVGVKEYSEVIEYLFEGKDEDGDLYDAKVFQMGV